MRLKKRQARREERGLVESQISDEQRSMALFQAKPLMAQCGIGLNVNRA
ncbi:MAG: hypothetical protein HQL69_22595 [Magnetococcales bacterium]|nr:hypothetical protein [Magnetococcales bacterium]